MSLFPNSAKKFISVCLSNSKLMGVFNSIGRPRPFDVTLRDGLQALSNEQQNLITTDKKKEIYNNLIVKYFPKNVEIGSCVNEKVLPIFKDTRELFTYVNDYNFKGVINNYVLVPNLYQLQNALKYGVKNFSFITSVSDSFQLKNTKMTLEKNEKNISEMLQYLDDYPTYRIDDETGDSWHDYSKHNIKLYVSCINECPIEGKMDTSLIIDKLEYLSNFKTNRICLSDTCGTLETEDFINILRMCKNKGIDITKFSMHLHVKPEREHIVEQLVFIALDNGINEFDVSELSTGGCSVTMDANKIAPNMNYEQYYRFLLNYLLNRM
jgi:hydroxymethylglutaryl-CoA lyase